MHRLLRSAIVVTLLTGLLSSAAAAGPMTDGERQRVLAHFEMTEGWLVSEVAGLSKAQLTFRMTPDSWSIQDVVEHLAIAEPQYWKQVQDSLTQPLGYKSSRPMPRSSGMASIARTASVPARRASRPARKTSSSRWASSRRSAPR